MPNALSSFVKNSYQDSDFDTSVLITNNNIKINNNKVISKTAIPYVFAVKKKKDKDRHHVGTLIESLYVTHIVIVCTLHRKEYRKMKKRSGEAWSDFPLDLLTLLQLGLYCWI